jgi:hypothetical protein
VLLFELAFAAYLRQFRVQLRPHQYGKARPVKPDHQCYGGAEGSVDRVELAEVVKIGDEKIRKAEPSGYSENRSGER